MSTISRRIAKLEAATRVLLPIRTMERHIIAGETEAERSARMKAILASSSGNVLHVFRVVIDPAETAQPQLEVRRHG